MAFVNLRFFFARLNTAVLNGVITLKANPE